jgi:hypothetical protein
MSSSSTGRRTSRSGSRTSLALGGGQPLGARSGLTLRKAARSVSVSTLPGLRRDTLGVGGAKTSGGLALPLRSDSLFRGGFISAPGDGKGRRRLHSTRDS